VLFAKFTRGKVDGGDTVVPVCALHDFVKRCQAQPSVSHSLMLWNATCSIALMHRQGAPIMLRAGTEFHGDSDVATPPSGRIQVENSSVILAKLARLAEVKPSAREYEAFTIVIGQLTDNAAPYVTLFRKDDDCYGIYQNIQIQK
jgi:hypothetical protein